MDADFFLPRENSQDAKSFTRRLAKGKTEDPKKSSWHSRAVVVVNPLHGLDHSLFRRVSLFEFLVLAFKILQEFADFFYP